MKRALSEVLLILLIKELTESPAPGRAYDFYIKKTNRNYSRIPFQPVGLSKGGHGRRGRSREKPMSHYNLVSFTGIFILVGFAWLISTDRRNVNYRVVIWGISLQLLFGAFIFLLPAGAKVFLFVNDIVVKVLGSASAGAEFLFGRLALPPGSRNAAGEDSRGQ